LDKHLSINRGDDHRHPGFPSFLKKFKPWPLKKLIFFDNINCVCSEIPWNPENFPSQAQMF